MRVDETPVHGALREALANALIHADYYGRCGIVIDKGFREIQIANPGLFRIRIDEAISGGISDARNSRIFNMFSLINVGERSGSGLCDLFNVWSENGYTRPKIVESVDPDRVVLTLRIGAASNDGVNDGVEGVNEGLNEGQNEGERNPLNKNTAAVLLGIRGNPTLTAERLAVDIGVSRSTVERCIKQLKEKGYIRREGADKTGMWIVLK